MMDGATIASFLADLTEGTIWVTHGTPCQQPYERYELADLLDQARSGSAIPAGADPG